MPEPKRPPSGTDLTDVLLAFYDCLTEPDQLETLMEVLTSWLDDEDRAVIAPKLDYHADRAWRLLGELSDNAQDAALETETVDVTRFDAAAEVQATFDAYINPDDQRRLQAWLEPEGASGALLLRVVEQNAVELVILSREPKDGAFVAKRAGAAFEQVLSRFVADSFDLTHAEFALLQQLLLGGTLREIAARVGKSWETVRSQVKSLTNKLGVRSQADILRMVNQAATLLPQAAPKDAPATEAFLGMLPRPDGRTICYEVDGPRSDRVLVYLHGMTQGRHWPDKARQEAVRRGWQVIRISRAGCGASTLNPKDGQALLQDHIDDVMAIMDHERISAFSIFGAADGFSVGYPLALQHPERVRMIVGLEVVPPILSRQVTSGFVGKMKTFGLTCLYAPKAVKFMLLLAMQQLERMEDRHAALHPLMGVVLRDIEDEDGLRADDLNFQDLMVHKADGMWRDASFSTVDWAYVPRDSNIRPRVALIHCGNSMVKSQGGLDEFAARIGAPILRIGSYLPYISAPLPVVLDAMEPI